MYCCVSHWQTPHWSNATLHNTALFVQLLHRQLVIVGHTHTDLHPLPPLSKSLCPALLLSSPVPLSLKWDNVKKELEGFAAVACSCKGGRITIQEFASFLKLPISPALQELFALFDRVRASHI